MTLLDAAVITALDLRLLAQGQKNGWSMCLLPHAIGVARAKAYIHWCINICLLLYVIRLAGWLKHCNLSLFLKQCVSQFSCSQFQAPWPKPTTGHASVLVVFTLICRCTPSLDDGLACLGFMHNRDIRPHQTTLRQTCLQHVHYSISHVLSIRLNMGITQAFKPMITNIDVWMVL